MPKWGDTDHRQDLIDMHNATLYAAMHNVQWTIDMWERRKPKDSPIADSVTNLLEALIVKIAENKPNVKILARADKS